MKHLRKLLVVLCFVFFITGAYSTTVDAAEYMELNVSVKGFKTVKLSWDKKSVDGYKIYRSLLNDVDKNGKFKYKLIATVSSYTTSYTDKKAKKNKYYVYSVVGYTNKNTKYKKKYWGEADCYTGLPRVAPDPDYFPDATPNKIIIEFGTSNIGLDSSSSLVPDGIQILKKKKGKYVPYKKISYKKYKKGYKFIDKKVNPRKIYSYKFRTYKKIKGKMVYSSSKHSEISIYALNNKPSCVIREIDGDSNELIISLTNHEKYGEIRNPASFCELDFDDDDKYIECEQEVIAYSFDKNTWSSDFKNCQLKPGETIYLKIKEKSGLSYTLDDICSLSVGGYFGNHSIIIKYNLAKKTTDSYCDD